MDKVIHRRGWPARALALALGVLVAGAVTAQTPAPDAKAATPPAKAAKAAKPTKKAAAPEFKLVLEPRAMDLLKGLALYTKRQTNGEKSTAKLRAEAR